MSPQQEQVIHIRVFGLVEWEAWLGNVTAKLYGLSVPEFEAARRRGALVGGSADDLGSILPMIHRLRAREAEAVSNCHTISP